MLLVNYSLYAMEDMMIFDMDESFYSLESLINYLGWDECWIDIDWWMNFMDDYRNENNQ